MADQLDPDIIQQLNEKFNELAAITSSAAARASASASATQNQTAAAKKNTDASNDNFEAIRRANQAIRQQSGAVDSSRATINRLNASIQDQYKAYEANQKAIEEIEKATNKAAQQERNKAIHLERAVESTIAAFEQLGKAIFDSSRGMSKYTGVVENLTTAVSALLLIFGGPLLKVVGLVVGALGKLFGAQLEQIEASNKLYESLSEFGALRLDEFGNGIQSITQDVHKFGLTVKNDGGLFVDSMKGMSKEIVALGGTVGQGRGQLADAFGANIGAPIEDELRRLGYNSQTYFKSWAKATQLAIQSGQAVGKSNSELNKQTNQYLKTLTELSELTGISRDEQMAIRERAMQDEAYFMKRREIAASGDDKALERFDKLTTVTNQFGDGIGQVIKEVTNAGGVVTERAAEINAFTNGAIERATQAYNRGAIDEQQLRKEIAEAVNSLRERFGSKAIAILGNDFAKAIGLSSEAMKASATIEKQSADAAKTARNVIDKIAAEGAGKERQIAIDENKMAIKNQQALEKVIQVTNGPLIGAFEKLIQVTNKLRDAFVKILRMVGIDAEAGTSAESKRRVQAAESSLEETKKSLEFQKQQAQKTAMRAAGIKEGETGTEEQRKKYQEIYNKELERTTKFDRERIASLETQRALSLEEERDRLIKEGSLKEEVKQNKELIAAKEKVAEVDKLIADYEGRRKKVLESLKLTEEDLKGRNYAKNIDVVRKAEQKYLEDLKEQRGIRAAEYAKKLEEQVKPAREGVAEPTSKSASTTISVADAKQFEGTQKEFYDKMYKTLLDEAKKAGLKNAEVIAKLGASQSALETGYGKSTAGAENYFGIKAQKGQPSNTVETTEWDEKKQQYVKQSAAFRKYGSMQESAADYIKFLQENKRYSKVLSAENIAEAIAEQGKTGYATDPQYVKKLADITARAEKTFAPQTQIAAVKPEKQAVPAQKPQVATAPPEKQAVPAQKPQVAAASPEKQVEPQKVQVALLTSEKQAVPAQKPQVNLPDINKMYGGGLSAKPMTDSLRYSEKDEVINLYNKLAELLPIKELIAAINRQTDLLVAGIDGMKDKMTENNSIASDQLLYLQT